MTRLLRPVLNFTANADILNLASSSEFKVGAKASAESVDFMIHGTIGDSYSGLDSSSVAQFLSEHRGKPVNVDINSGGGLSFDGVSIYNAFAQHDGVVTTKITGIAASAAATIFEAGDKRIIAANGTLMIHRNWGVGIGNKKVLLDLADFLDQMDSQLAATYSARTGRKLETMLKLMEGEVDGTTFSGQAAVDAGFADSVMPLKKKTRADGESNESQFNAEAAVRLKRVIESRLRILHIDGDTE